MFLLDLAMCFRTDGLGEMSPVRVRTKQGIFIIHCCRSDMTTAQLLLRFYYTYLSVESEILSDFYCRHYDVDNIFSIHHLPQESS